MKKSILAMATAMLLFVGCDKIEPSEDGTFIEYAGAVGEWEDANPLSDQSQRVWIEKYTGVRCTNCPDADEVITSTLSSYAGRVFATSIHDSVSFGDPVAGSRDLRTAVGTAWCNYFASDGMKPTALLNRQVTVTPTSPFTGDIDALLAESPKVAVAVASHWDDQAGKISVTTTVQQLSEVSDDLTLTLLVMEDSLIAAQKYPDHTDTNYVHNHVLRSVITDKWGFDITGLSVGTAKKVTLRGDLPEGAVMSRCKIVALVSNKGDRKVLNCAECEVTE